MRRPSRSSIILLILSPIAAGILLWYVVFPSLDKNIAIGYSEASVDPGNFGGESSNDMSSGSSGGFDEIQDKPASAPSDATINSYRSSASNPATQRIEDYKLQNESNGNAVASQPGVVSTGQRTVERSSNSAGGGTSATTNSSIPDNIAPIAATVQRVKETGENINKIIDKQKDQSKIGTNGGLLLLPPDDPDPLDVPLDGGTTILVATAIGYGIKKYRGAGKRKTLTAKEQDKG